MTTNQTIDGVPRELLDDLASYGESGKVPEPWMVEKLRALLESPASCETCGGSGRFGMGFCECCQEAAQPLGAPVAYRVVFNDGEKSKWEDGAPQGQDLYDVRDGVIRAVERAYAEQPAPVAVVMPERSSALASANINHRQAYSLGWNACLDELKRLNAKPTCCGSCPGWCTIGSKP